MVTTSNDTKSPSNVPTHSATVGSTEEEPAIASSTLYIIIIIAVVAVLVITVQIVTCLMLNRRTRNVTVTQQPGEGSGRFKDQNPDLAQSIEAPDSHEYATIDDEFRKQIHEMNVNEAYRIVAAREIALHSQESALELETQTTSL